MYHPGFTVTPDFCFVAAPCCTTAASHKTNFGKARLHHVHAEGPKPDPAGPHEKNFQGVKVVDVMELICDKGFNLEKAKTAAKSALAINTVHPTGHGFAKCVSAALPATPAPGNVIATTETAATANKSDVGDGGVSVMWRTGPRHAVVVRAGLEHMG